VQRVWNALLASWLFADAAVELSIATDDGGQRGFLGLALLLLALAVLHRGAPSEVDHRPPVIALVLLSVFLSFGFLIVPSRPMTDVGVVVSWAGVGVMLWCVAALGQNFAVFPQRRSIVAHGPYRFVRHPMYLGYLLQDLGAWVVAGTLATAALWIVLCALFLVRARFEERCLRGDPTYVTYAQRVRYRLVPGVV
jgi:protein-S-isoprenylcysteine O-methyltransferase Ste14